MLGFLHMRVGEIAGGRGLEHARDNAFLSGGSVAMGD